MYDWRVKRLLRIVDGDTFDVVIGRGFGETSALRFRVYGVDAPESRGVHASPAGAAATDFAAAWWIAHFDGHDAVVARSRPGSDAAVGIGDGAFGRWLASFTCSCGADYAADLVVAGYSDGEA